MEPDKDKSLGVQITLHSFAMFWHWEFLAVAVHIRIQSDKVLEFCLDGSMNS